MKPLRWVFQVGLMIGILAIISADFGVSAAQEYPDIPQATMCTVTPRSMGDVVLLASGLAASASVESTPATGQVPPALDELTATVIESVACINANSPLQWLALFSDRYVAERFGPDAPDALGSLQSVLTRSPDPAVPDDQLSIVAVEPGDSAFSMRVTTANMNETFTDLLEFVWEGGRWLIDRVTPVDEAHDQALLQLEFQANRAERFS